MLTRADIRRVLLERGRYDLSNPEDVSKLDRYVRGFERWIKSEVAELMDGDPIHLNPRELLDGVKWGGSNTTKKNERDTLDLLKRRKSVKFIGNGSLRAALAFSKQACLQWGWTPFYIQASNLITQDEDEPLTDGPRSVLILDTTHDTDDGKMFVEMQSRMVSALKSHQGATIVVTENETYGVLDSKICGVLKPRLKLKVTTR